MTSIKSTIFVIFQGGAFRRTQPRIREKLVGALFMTIGNGGPMSFSEDDCTS